MKQDTWIANYKHRYYIQYLNSYQYVKLHVNASGIRFKLELVDEQTKNYYPIACSNNMQILKDLTHAIKNGLDRNYILNSFHMLQINNLEMII